ncbi:hypothetical protein ACLB2K_047016 [Fragaria x ananassa]
MSSPVVRERQYIVSCAYQELEANPELLGELPCNPPDMVPIVFELLKTVRSGFIDEEDEEPPKEKHQTIIHQIFKEVDRDSQLRPLWPLNVIVNNVTVQLRLRPSPPPPSSPVYFGAFLGLLDLYTEYLSMITDNEEVGLEIVGPDSLEAKKQESCPICMDDFEEKEDAAPIARLLSFFHNQVSLHLEKHNARQGCSKGWFAQWKVGDGKSVRIWSNKWLPLTTPSALQRQNNNMEMVSDLMQFSA